MENLRLAETLTRSGQRLPDELLALAQSRSVTKIVLGKHGTLVVAAGDAVRFPFDEPEQLLELETRGEILAFVRSCGPVCDGRP